MTKTFTAFADARRIAAGPLSDVTLTIKRRLDGDAACSVQIFDDASGEQIDIDTRGTDAEILSRLPKADAGPDAGEARGRGRPKLGVVSREITLLPRHWEWLNMQPGGASVTLRKLVEDARRSPANQRRQKHEAAYRVMAAIAGNQPGFEEASRAMFAHDHEGFCKHAKTWPHDIRHYIETLAFAESGNTPPSPKTGPSK